VFPRHTRPRRGYHPLLGLLTCQQSHLHRVAVHPIQATAQPAATVHAFCVRKSSVSHSRSTCPRSGYIWQLLKQRVRGHKSASCGFRLRKVSWQRCKGARKREAGSRYRAQTGYAAVFGSLFMRTPERGFLSFFTQVIGVGAGCVKRHWPC
jgi:hypothetical protein